MITLHTFLIYFGDHRMKALWIVCTQLSISQVSIVHQWSVGLVSNEY